MKKHEYQWSLAEMGSRERPETDEEPLKIRNVSSDNPGGEELDCEFSLYYSFPKPNERKDGKNILFIPGGPGSIAPLDQSEPLNRLELLEHGQHNVAYFHVRGTGLSTIPPSNKYDRFLRADYVVGDIEQLRIHLLGKDTPWDAIWGESHGALIAQRYAHKYGTDRVKKLILVGPPSRSDETHDPRRKMIVSNLVAILRYYRGKTSENSTNEKPSAKSKAEEPGSPTENDESATDYFSFLTQQSIRKIENKVGTILEKLEDSYGSINFVIENYSELKQKEPSFKQYPYPEEFFKAFRYLQFHGRPVKGLEFSNLTKRLHVDAGLLIAYYLTLPPKYLDAWGDRRAVFGKTPAPVMRGLSSERRIAYVERLQKAQANIAKDEPKSRRAYWVFGVYDGISRWILSVMEDPINKDGFFRSEDIKRRVTGPVERLLAEKIGIVPGEAIYPWNAGYYKHDVPTFILRGDADAVTAGGQAESFFKDGLANKYDSVLMEFPGMGHIWRTSMPEAKIGVNTLAGDQVLQTLVEKFLAEDSASTFLNDPKVEAIIHAIGVSVWCAPQSRGVKLANPKVKKLISSERKKLWDTIMRLRRRTLVPALEKNSKFYAEAQKNKIIKAPPSKTKRR
jgi:pimeloyl-ACP methyl ester carboxylesterase